MAPHFQGANHMAAPDLEPLFSYDVHLQALPEVIGKGPDGIRVNFYIERGSIDGPQLYGSFLPGGGDWMTIRRDGVAILDVRATIDASLGPAGLIFMTYTGIIDFGRDGFEKWETLLAHPNENVFENQQVFVARSTPRFFTADPNFEWLNRLQCVAFGEINVVTKNVHFEVFAVAPSEFRLSQRVQMTSAPDQLFAPLTDPAKLQQVLPIGYGSLKTFDVDVQVGKPFKIVVAGRDDAYTYAGVFKEVTPPQKLVFTWKAHDSLESVVTVELQAQEEKTQLTLTQLPFESRQMRNRYLELWDIGLKNLTGF
jgi:uncharacterized protein YndB with AHSA1/START domain